ncbi:MAG: tyrosine-type recombinase/integrase [Dehalococcoidales bacterium]|nr:tyrosine-type recombinase/integrase [Dehalococcoidales bacterium]
MLPKQDVEGSNPFTRSKFYTQNSCELFTKKFAKSQLDNFIKSRASGTNPRTITLYQFALDNFIGYPLTPEGIQSYLDSLTCRNGKHNYYRVIKTLCRWLYHTDQLSSNPIEKVLPPRRQKKLLPAISKEQLAILVSHALTEKDRIILNLLWYSGMRLSEIANIKAKDFYWDEGIVIVLGKGNRYRKALAGNSIVKEWFSKHDTLEITARGIATMLQRLGQATGIHCNAHSFRRGFCVHNVKSGLSNRVIQALGGWETPAMVSHYAASLTFDDALSLYKAANSKT